MASKHNYEYVRKYVETNGNGDKLVSNVYIGTKEKLVFHCHMCNKDFEMCFSNYQSGQRHKECMKKIGGEKRRFSYEYVKEYVEKRGCFLLSDSYVKQEVLLKIIFSCGHEEERRFVDFKKGKNICSRCSGCKKYTFEEAKQIFESKKYFLLSTKEEYDNGSTSLLLNDLYGYKYNATLGKFLSHQVSRGDDLSKFDKKNPHAMNNFKLFMHNSNLSFCLEEKQKWFGLNKKMIFFDNDGYKYYITPISLLNDSNIIHGPDKFSAHNIFTLDNLKIWLKLNNKTFSLIDGQKYIGTCGKLKFKCHICSSDEMPFETNLQSILSNKGCNFCSHTKVGKCNNLSYLYPEVAKEWDYEKNYPMHPEESFPRNRKKYWWVCPDCKRSYLAAVSGRTGKYAYGCPACLESNLEKKIRAFLEKNNIDFVPQKRFKDCRDKCPLPFDFYLINLNICCEAQGLQHIKSVDHFGGEKSFEIRKEHDKIKKDYCKNNNIKLIEIFHWDYKNVEQILIKELNLSRKEA